MLTFFAYECEKCKHYFFILLDVLDYGLTSNVMGKHIKRIKYFNVKYKVRLSSGGVLTPSERIVVLSEYYAILYSPLIEAGVLEL